MNDGAADWILPDYRVLATESDIVVSGTYTGPPAPVRTGQADSGELRIERVFKGNISGDRLVLRLPRARPKGLVASTDIQLQPAQRGLWFLRKEADDRYRLDRPWCHVPPEQMETVLQQLH